LQLERVRVPVEGLSPALDGLRIVQLSDLHLSPNTSLVFIEQAVAAANALRPDLVVLTGDYVSGRAAGIEDLAPVLGHLKAPLGVYAVLGNHDLWTDAGCVVSALIAAGLSVLVNQGRVVHRGGAALYIAGLDDGWSGRPDLPRAMQAHLPGAPTVLLLHEPDLAKYVAQDTRITLQLSGHSHGGQVRLPFIGAPVLPHLGRVYDMGLYRVNRMWLYTNRGVGVAGLRVRFNCRPEITELTLTHPDRSAKLESDGLQTDL
jgi:hypothetical protein